MDMSLIEMLVYLGKIIVFSRTHEEHEAYLGKVLERFHDEELKLSLKKCQFHQPFVTYLRHVVSVEGVVTDPKKLETVTSWPIPNNVT